MDRLTTLIERFQLRVQAANADEANLVALADATGTLRCLMFFPVGGRPGCAGEVVLQARVDWSGDSNPFLAALPQLVEFDLARDEEARSLVLLMRSETAQRRCGAETVINRLGEVLMVRLLRDQMMRGTTEPGLLAGLADPRLSRAIVAMHDQPGRVWTNADLAAEAGLSLSRFAELFSTHVGETPMGYLRRWRLILARQDLQRGHRVDTVSRRYAYGSPEAFARAFRRAYGVAPLVLRAG